MRKTILAVFAATLVAGSAWAQDKGAKPAAAPAAAPAAPPAGGPDMSKMGPWSRKPTNEAKTKKEIADFYKEVEEGMKKGDVDGAIAMVDFPVYMMTDDSKGVPKSGEWTKEMYTAMMKPMMENIPKDVKMTHKPTVTVLSDSLVNVTDDFTMSHGKDKMSGRSLNVLVKKDGKWKWKVMGEAGWGDMPMPSAAPAAAAPATK
jgi:hypothetical protein